ncbi:MAG: leucine-rich repeat protein [Bacteroidales bacterium]|nr:leucine-rich repeat protein [Bacteroidales bacterium]
MKKLHVILLCGMLCTANLNAQTQIWNIGSPTAEDVTATLSNDTLTISGTGAMQNWTSSANAPWNSHSATITTVIIEDGVTSIGTRAFRSHSSLTLVTIGNSVTAIEDDAFRFSTVKKLVIEDGTSTLSVRGNQFLYAFISASIDTLYLGRNISRQSGLAEPWFGEALKDITIGNSVTTIGGSAFRNCAGLTSVTIPNNVTTIEAGAFWNCTGLTSVTIPDNVITIGNAAFSGCTGLISVTIGNSVTTLGQSAFGGCTGLTSLTSLAPTPPTLGATVFTNVDMTTCCLYVPTSSVDLYSSASQWSAFTCVNPDGAYTVNFNSQGGSHVGLQLIITPDDKAVEPDVPTFTGFTFLGWYTEPECINIWHFDTDIVTSDTTLYAKWTVSVYTVTFNSQGGSAVAEQQIYHNDQASEPVAPTSEGFIFSGWYKEPECINIWDFDTDITSHVTLYARWALDMNMMDDLNELIAQLRDSIDKLTLANEALQGDTARLHTDTLRLYEQVLELRDTIFSLVNDTIRLYDQVLELRDTIFSLVNDTIRLCDTLHLYDRILDLQTEVSTLQTNNNILLDSLRWLDRLIAECNNPNVALQFASDLEIRVFPNPIVSELHVIILSNFAEINDIVEIYDMTGKRVFLARIANGTTEFSIDMSNFLSGQYILRIGNRMTKILKQ